ncbi:MAG: NUDIX domain-containing protein [Patescibacteria group bacterium]
MKKSTNWLTDDEYKTYYSRVPRLCLDLAIIDPDGAMLIVKRTIKPHKGRWCLPGGRRLYKENVRKTIARILKKELGIKVDGKPQLVGEMEFIHDGPFVHSVSNVYRIKITSEEKARISLDEQGGRFRFVHAAPRNMQPGLRRFCIEHRLLASF